MNEQTIFTAALEREPGERSLFLDEACEADQELRQRVEKLLRLHADAGSFLDSPVADSSPTLNQAGSEKPGTQIGPYKLLQQIGEGGMGVVWMAEQTQPVQRKVALKVIKPGMDSRQVIARFEAERQALAMMDHVNIARVLDAGTTESGLPYFVMELVHGVPITKYCDDNHLTPRQRLELFVPVCQAIQHAHQKGIIHRDIKPSNVMITLYDGKPVPKVIDFGVAKATEQTLTERTLFTQYGTMVGTLEYMSPEQAEMSALGVDTRSDIFSLGALLYELLTGSTPLTRKRLKEAAYAEVLRLIKEEEPPKPSTRLTESGAALASISAQRHTEPAKLTKLVRGELDWIVMKTLEKDRNRRYETANGLAADVQRYLSDETVLACPPSRWYRFRKFARRNKAALVMASVVGMGVLLLVVALAVGIVLVNREKELVKDERDQKDQALQLADANLTQAHESVNRYFTIVSEDTLLDAPGLQPLRKQLLEAALKYYQGFLQQRSHDPKLQADVAVTYLRVSVIHASLGENDEAVLALITGLETVDRLVREHPSDTELPKRFAGYFSSRRPFHSTGQAMKTDPRRVVQALQRSAELWEGFARDNPTTAGFRSDLVATYTLLGGVLAGINQDEALITYRKASETAEKLVYENPAVPSYRERQAKIYYDLASALKSFGRTHEAETTYRQAVECFEKASAEFPGEPDFRANLGISLKNLANFFAVCGRAKEAEDAFRRSVVLLDKVVNDFPNNVDYRDALSVSYDGLANCLVKDSGRLQEAEKVLRQALTIHEKLASDFPHVPNYRRALASSYGILSGVLKKDRPEEAVQALRQKLTVREKLVIDYPTIERYSGELLETQEQLINLLGSTGKSQEVEKLWRQAVVRFEKLAAANPSVPSYRLKLVFARRDLAERLRGSKDRLGDAEKLHLQALAEVKELAKEFPKAPEYVEMAGHSYRYLGWIARDTGRPDDAVAYFEKGIAAFQKLADADIPQRDGFYREYQAGTLEELALVLAAGGHVQEAEAAHRRAIDLREPLAKASPERRLAQANNYNDLAMLLMSAKRLPEAEEASRQAVNWKQALVSDFPEKPEYRFHLAHSYLGLGYILRESGRVSDAVQATSDADRLLKQLASDASALAVLRDQLGHTLWQLSEAWTRLKRSDDALQANQRALEAFQQLAADHPENPFFRQETAFGHRKLADLMNHDGRNKDAESQLRAALACYQKLVAESPDSAFYRQEAAFVDCGLANLLLRTGLADEAEKTIRRSIETYELLVRDYPQNADYRQRAAAAVRVLAELLAQQKKLPEASVEWDKAAAAYTKDIELKPDEWESWSGRAFVYFHRQEWDKAVSDFSKAIDLAPQVHTNWFHRGHAYLNLAQWDKARADFAKVVDQWPNYPEGWYYRGVAFAQLNQPDKALADLQQAIAKGFKGELIKNDPRLAPLHSNDEFKKLLTKFENDKK